MRILVLGAAGMLGRKLIERLLRNGELAGRAIESIDAFDVLQADCVDGRVTTHAGDIAEPATVSALVARQPDVIFHLAAVVSGEAEADFDKGYRINLDGTANLFDAIVARLEYCPRVIFASSIAVFGAPFPDVIPDHWHPTPRTSYGAQKAVGELLLSDYSRRGFMDGLALRLPTVCVRPGKPNAAASGFFSNIIREPLVGKPANLPVPDSLVHWHASPRATVGFLLHAACLDTAHVGPNRALMMPGVAVSVGEQLAALRRVAGQQAVDLVTREPDDAVSAIVSNWPSRFDAKRALDLGFVADADFDAIIAAHIEDEAISLSA